MSECSGGFQVLRKTLSKQVLCTEIVLSTKVIRLPDVDFFVVTVFLGL